MTPSEIFAHMAGSESIKIFSASEDEDMAELQKRFEENVAKFDKIQEAVTKTEDLTGVEIVANPSRFFDGGLEFNDFIFVEAGASVAKVGDTDAVGLNELGNSDANAGDGGGVEARDGEAGDGSNLTVVIVGNNNAVPSPRSVKKAPSARDGGKKEKEVPEKQPRAGTSNPAKASKPRLSRKKQPSVSADGGYEDDFFAARSTRPKRNAAVRTTYEDSDDDVDEEAGAKSPKPEDQPMTVCPICGQMYPGDLINAHASGCGVAEPDLEDIADPTEMASAALPPPVRTGNKYICPRCNKSFITTRKYDVHSCGK